MTYDGLTLASLLTDLLPGSLNMLVLVLVVLFYNTRLTPLLTYLELLLS